MDDAEGAVEFARGRERGGVGFVVGSFSGRLVVETKVTPNDTAYWIMRAEVAEKQCKDLEAETVATRELLERAEERCEELERNRADLGAQLTAERMARHAKEGDGPVPYWQSGVSCEVDGDLVIHRYKSVTVMVRGEKEATCRETTDRWWSGIPGTSTFDVFRTREEAEAWCREQLESKRRKAGTEDEGSACWVKDADSTEWKEAVLVHCDFLYENPYVAAMDGWLCGWEECEVQE